MTFSRASFVVLAIVAASAGACTTHPSPTRIRRAPLPRGASAHFSHAPTVDGSRQACLAPPYTPPPDATALADGTPVRRSENGRQWIASLQGESVPTQAQAGALVERLRARGGMFTWITYGLYCGDMPTGLCLEYSGNLCEMRIEETAHTLLTAIAADPILPRPRIDLALELAGALGPRCTATDPACRPVAYDHGAHFDPAGPRHPGVLADHSTGSCRHDGDCSVAGCGNHCMSWEYGGAHEGATCEGYVFERPIFCGCVEGECGWFSQ